MPEAEQHASEAQQASQLRAGPDSSSSRSVLRTVGVVVALGQGCQLLKAYGLPLSWGNLRALSLATPLAPVERCNEIVEGLVRPGDLPHSGTLAPLSSESMAGEKAHHPLEEYRIADRPAHLPGTNEVPVTPEQPNCPPKVFGIVHELRWHQPGVRTRRDRVTNLVLTRQVPRLHPGGVRVGCACPILVIKRYRLSHLSRQPCDTHSQSILILDRHDTGVVLHLDPLPVVKYRRTHRMAHDAGEGGLAPEGR